MFDHLIVNIIVYIYDSIIKLISLFSSVYGFSIKKVFTALNFILIRIIINLIMNLKILKSFYNIIFQFSLMSNIEVDNTA